jgi:hypothetical protein
MAWRAEARERLEPVGDSLGREHAELANTQLHPLANPINDHDAPAWGRNTVDDTADGGPRLAPQAR